MTTQRQQRIYELRKKFIKNRSDEELLRLIKKSDRYRFSLAELEYASREGQKMYDKLVPLQIQ